MSFRFTQGSRRLREQRQRLHRMLEKQRAELEVKGLASDDDRPTRQDSEREEAGDPAPREKDV